MTELMWNGTVDGYVPRKLVDQVQDRQHWLVVKPKPVGRVATATHGCSQYPKQHNASSARKESDWKALSVVLLDSRNTLNSASEKLRAGFLGYESVW